MTTIKNNQTTNKLRVLVITGFIIISHQLVNAQANQNPQFLHKVGVLDSLYSQILKESREIYIQLPANYSFESNQKYPVVYILDGEVFFPTAAKAYELSGSDYHKRRIEGLKAKN